MPLPLGHTAIGLLTYECGHKKTAYLNKLKVLIFIVMLANLPDIDVIFGLILKMDGNAFHRGPTHSLMFAVITGFVASGLWKISAIFPQLSFGSCFSIVFSHTLTDLFLTASPVSLFWPFEVHWASGHADLNAILHEVLFKGYRDVGIILVCMALIMAIRMIKHRLWDTTGSRPPHLQKAVMPIKTKI